MKNTLLLISSFLVVSFLTCNAFASKQVIVNKNLKFAPQSWVSRGPNDVVSIQQDLSELNVYSVQIYVNPNYAGPNPSGEVLGVVVRNCGNITRIAPGSSAICKLTPSNPSIFFAAEKDGIASGTYQIEK